MTSEVDTAVDVAALLAERLSEARAMADRVEAARDAAIRRAAALGASRTELARRVGVHRSRLYVVLEEPDTEDPALWEWLSEQDDIAEQRWESNDHEGSVDDYWPSKL